MSNRCVIRECGNDPLYPLQCIVMPYVQFLEFRKPLLKDLPEWEASLQPFNYTVTENTVVCSNHFTTSVRLKNPRGKPLNCSPTMHLSGYPPWAKPTEELKDIAVALDHTDACKLMSHLLRKLSLEAQQSVLEKLGINNSKEVDAQLKDVPLEQIRHILGQLHLFPPNVYQSAMSVYNISKSPRALAIETISTATPRVIRVQRVTRAQQMAKLRSSTTCTQVVGFPVASPTSTTPAKEPQITPVRVLPPSYITTPPQGQHVRLERLNSPSTEMATSVKVKVLGPVTKSSFTVPQLKIDGGWPAVLMKEMMKLRQEEFMCDVTILTRDHQTLVAHQCILSAASPVFKAALQENRTLRTSQYTSAIWEQALSYIYTGMLLVKKIDFDMLMALAKEFGLRKLMELLISETGPLPTEAKKILPEEIRATLLTEDASLQTLPVGTIQEVPIQEVLIQEEIEQLGQTMEEDTYKSDTDYNDIYLTPTESTAQDHIISVPSKATQDLSLVPSSGESMHYQDDMHEDIMLQTGAHEEIAVPAVTKLVSRKRSLSEEVLTKGFRNVDRLAKGTLTFNMHGKSNQYYSENLDMNKVIKNRQAEYHGFKFDKKTNKRVPRLRGGKKPGPKPRETEQNMEQERENTAKKKRVEKVVEDVVCPFCRKFKFNTRKLSKMGYLVHLDEMHTNPDGTVKEECLQMYEQRRMFAEDTNLRCVQKDRDAEGNVTGRAWVCPHCRKLYGCFKNFREHVATHDGHAHVCYLCKVSSVGKIALSRHYKHVHDIEDPHKASRNPPKTYMCEICGKVAKSSIALKEHANVHKGLKPYSCRYCSRSYASNVNRKDHERIHDVSRMLLCSGCGYQTAQRKNMRKHEKRCAEFKGDFQCDFCGQTFSVKRTCNQHMKQCQAEKETETETQQAAQVIMYVDNHIDTEPETQEVETETEAQHIETEAASQSITQIVPYQEEIMEGGGYDGENVVRIFLSKTHSEARKDRHQETGDSVYHSGERQRGGKYRRGEREHYQYSNS